MPEEHVACCNVMKQRSVQQPVIVKESEDDENFAIIQAEDDPPKPGLLWRVGSGLWGATSVSIFKIRLVKNMTQF